jgi:hypothetical protein
MITTSQKVVSFLAVAGLASASAAQAQQVVKPANSSTAQTPVLLDTSTVVGPGGSGFPP